MMHDFMSYGAGDFLPRWGGIASTRWTSDINYHRIARFLEECVSLDPPNRFWGPAPAEDAEVKWDKLVWIESSIFKTRLESFSRLPRGASPRAHGPR